MLPATITHIADRTEEFQWAPTLGGECYVYYPANETEWYRLFQWAPTLGGECYQSPKRSAQRHARIAFQWAPTLGGECYLLADYRYNRQMRRSFNGHPPLGVNATV